MTQSPSTNGVSLVVAVNDEGMLRSSLLASPDIAAVEQVILKRGARSAAQTYTEGLAESRGEYVVFVHQDVFLPRGWLECLQRQIDRLTGTDPNWGVCGAYGVTSTGEGAGHIYSTGLGTILGGASLEARLVDTLDELLLVLRRRGGLRFDERLPGFHLYGSDICLEARTRGMNAYALAAFCIHNSRGIRFLPQGYWKAYCYMRRKWWNRLPVETPCLRLSRSPLPALRYVLWRVPSLLISRGRVGKPSMSPAALHEQLRATSMVRETNPARAERPVANASLS